LKKKASSKHLSKWNPRHPRKERNLFRSRPRRSGEKPGRLLKKLKVSISLEALPQDPPVLQTTGEMLRVFHRRVKIFMLSKFLIVEQTKRQKLVTESAPLKDSNNTGPTAIGTKQKKSKSRRSKRRQLTFSKPLTSTNFFTREVVVRYAVIG
jgi:hypothetical protein